MEDNEKKAPKRITLSDREMNGVAGGEEDDPHSFWCGDPCPRCKEADLTWRQIMVSVFCPNCGWEPGMPLSSH